MILFPSPSKIPFAIFAVLAACIAWPAADAQGEYFDSEGVNIYYEIHGEGEPVVLIHGFSASGATNWRLPGVVGKLSEHYKVILPDVRGHGKSAKPHGRERYGRAMGDDIMRLLDHLDIERAHIAGYSMGGFISVDLLVRYPERFQTAIIGGAGFSQPNTDGDIREDLAQSLENGTGILPLLKMLAPEGTPEAEAATMEATNNAVVALNDPIALAGVIRSMDDLVVTREQLAKNEVPTLAVIGSLDPLKTTTDALAAVLPNITVKVLDGKTHITAMGDPEFPATMLSFMEQHAAELAATATDDD